MATRRRAPVYNPILDPIEKAAVDALEATGGKVLATAKENAGKRTGRLRRSGKIDRQYLTVRIRFTAPHAWIHHERPGPHAKFLERALDAHDAAPDMASAIQAVFKHAR